MPPVLRPLAQRLAKKKQKQKARSSHAGGGQTCYTSQAACNVGANSCDSTAAPCAHTTGICGSGAAGGASTLPIMLHAAPGSGAATSPATSPDTSYSWFCPTDEPVGALPAGSGALCYDTAANCANGPLPAAPACCFLGFRFLGV